jgi:DNA-binding NarL/FixJ family response regulator
VNSEPSPANKASTSTRIVVADDHDLIRAGIRLVLDRQSDLEVVGEASNGREALELCRRLRPDVVLMDVSMPEMDGLAATRAIKQDNPAIGVLILTGFQNPDYLFEALKAGVAGYILKDAPKSELIDAIRRVLNGELLLDPSLAAELLRKMAREKEKESLGSQPEPKKGRKALLEPLTDRECEVLGLLARGQTNREIAQNLVVSPWTVKAHVGHIIGKLGVSDRTQAAVRAIELGLVTAE